MNRFFQRSIFVAAIVGLVTLVSCSEDPPLPDNISQFESDAVGFASSETSLNVTVKFDREAAVAGNVVVGVEANGVAYGTDFTTEPALSGSSITLPVTEVSTLVTFKVNKTNTSGLDGDEKIVFTIQSVPSGLVLGEKKTLTMTFAELLAQSASMEVSGGGATFPNLVFIDLSGNRQTGVSRTSWDLAFSSTADEFRVVLNSPNGMLARALDKNDLASVTASDTVGFSAQLNLNAIFAQAASATDPNALPDWVKNSTQWMDNPAGDITKTAIAAVSATASENKVYIINRGTGPNNTNLGWKKVRIVRNGNNYVLQHADIASANFTSVEVTKNTGTRFQYVSFANGVVNVAPATDRWDIAWTGFTNTTNFGPGTPTIPYYFQDVIIQNTVGVQTYNYVTNTTTQTKTYDTFAEADLSSITTWSSSQVGIGSSWRTTGPPPAPVGTRTDRFFLIKDAAGNVYKLKFTALTTNGERGKPQFTFALVKKGS